MASSTVTTSVKLDAETRERIQRLAVARDRSAHWLIRKAIEQYIDREEALERFRQDGLSAWALYQASGHHVSAEEADAWMARLESGEIIDPPG